MEVLQYVLGGVLIALAVALTVMVLFQSAKDTRLSGTIAGGAETFFGKNKAKGLEAKLALITKVCAIAFVVLAIINLFLN